MNKGSNGTNSRLKWSISQKKYQNGTKRLPNNRTNNHATAASAFASTTTPSITFNLMTWPVENLMRSTNSRDEGLSPDQSSDAEC
jgi:hypothetical protein